VAAVAGLEESGAVGAPREFAVFAIVGAICASVNFGVGVLVRYAAPLEVEWPSVTAGFVAATVLSFVLNRRYTFRVQANDAGPQAARFALTAIVALPLWALVAEVLARILRLVPAVSASTAAVAHLAHVGTIGVLFVFNFYAIKFFALRA
jgi:putative flippase GtrA